MEVEKSPKIPNFFSCESCHYYTSNKKDLAKHLNCEFDGDPEMEVTGINEIHVVEKGDMEKTNHYQMHQTPLSMPFLVHHLNGPSQCVNHQCEQQ